MVMSSVLKGLVQGQRLVCVAVERYGHCALLLKAPSAQIRGLGRVGRGVQAIVTFVTDSPEAKVRLDWHFPKGTAEEIRAIENIPSAPLAGWLLRRLLTQDGLELHLLDEMLEPVDSLPIEWPVEKRAGAALAYENALERVPSDQRGTFFAPDPDYRVGEPLAT